ncbi:MAG TPA: peptide chain release factor N(5)-glutamine methyltransferase [Thiobacillaceae bacterium]|nr:peptide chain release factor N(5)-glutamine methyltransferase [Thiobacillaceae bacterium]
MNDLSAARAMTTIKEILFRDSALLSRALALQAAESRLEIRVLLEHALNVDRAWLLTHDDEELETEFRLRYESLLARRLSGEPIAYILGRREFYGRVFKVGPAVLIPRPETELLVEAALERLPKDRPARVLDLGTGSGCVGISIALERRDCEVLAVDVSTTALEMAKENAADLGASNVRFLISDWYAQLATMSFDMIISNPPYIASGDAHLSKGDLCHEPSSALASGSVGLDAIRIIVLGAAARLHPHGWLILEHGYEQANACRALLNEVGLKQIFTLADLAGHTRVTGGQWPG